jgi:hypothetical protein
MEFESPWEAGSPNGGAQENCATTFTARYRLLGSGLPVFEAPLAFSLYLESFKIKIYL